MAADPVRRDELHRLVDELPDESLEPVVRLLRRAQDPMIAVLDAAPADDEPFTLEQRTAVEAAQERMRRGKGVPLEQAIAEIEAED
jgi:hypothetical protein